MAVNKDQEMRIRQLCDRFSRETGKNSVLQLKQLARDLGISFRQINYDKEVLIDRGAPLSYDGTLRGWRFSHPFHIYQIELTSTELVQFRIGLALLSKLQIWKSKPELVKGLQNIHYQVREKSEKEAQKQEIYFDPLPEYAGSKHLEMVLHAIEHKKQVTFAYKGFESVQAKTVIFDPYFLRHFDRRWYVGGYSHDPSEQFVRTFPLERIISEIKVTGFAYTKPSHFDPEQYWKNIYGITLPPDRKMETIEIAFSPLQGNYFLSAPFFEPYQLLEQSETNVIIRLHLMINIELIRQLASLGKEVKVLKPDRLAKELYEFHLAALASMKSDP